MADPKNSLAAYYYGITLIQDKQEAKGARYYSSFITANRPLNMMPLIT
jgi:hypothetical protein